MTVIPRFVSVRAENVGKLIAAEGFVVDICGQMILLQKVPKLKRIDELDMPLNVPPGWFASWPLKCVLNGGLTERVRRGNHIKIMGKLGAESEQQDPLFSPGFSYVLKAWEIEGDEK